jgi:flagellar protein FlaG
MVSEITPIQPVSAPKAPPAPVPKAREAPPTDVSAPNPANVGVNYEVDQKTGKVIILMVDQATGEVIREIPSEEIQQMSRALEAVLGRLYDQKG